VIIDAHVHLSRTSYGNAALYLAAIREAGIDAGMVVPGGMMDVRRMTDYVIGRADPENPVPDNDYIMECIIADSSRFQGFVCLDPHGEDAAAELEGWFARGLVGLKLSPMTHRFSFACNAVAALAVCCGEHGLPLYAHTVYNPGASTARFLALAKQFPGTHFILGHMGFGPADREAVEAAATLDNLFLETSTGNFLQLQEALARAGHTKLIFGSEFPLSHPRVELEKILLLSLRGHELDKVLGGNIRALCGWPSMPAVEFGVKS